jgi:hypothetical protein
LALSRRNLLARSIKSLIGNCGAAVELGTKASPRASGRFSGILGKFKLPIFLLIRGYFLQD